MGKRPLRRKPLPAPPPSRDPVAGGRARGRASFVTDPLTGELAELSSVPPYQALKQYVCPGCNQEIRPRTGHVVVVPLRLPDERRHWHRPCFERAARRLGPAGR
ncbi:MAG: hypothetical protein ACRDZ6_02680 [Acidimicrobiales bacterium]